MPPNLSKPSPPLGKAEAPTEAIKAHNTRLHQQWLADPSTRKFFKALENKRVSDLTAAASNSELTAIDNAREHNRLVAANTIRKLIETYGTPDKYPYDDFDRIDSKRVPLPDAP